MPITGLPQFPQPTHTGLRYAQGAAYDPQAHDQMLALNSEYSGFRIATIQAKTQLVIYGKLKDPAVASGLDIQPDPQTYEDGTPFPDRWAFAVLFYGDNPVVTWNFVPAGTKLV